MEPRMLGTKAVPLGVRFNPTDEELVMYYLRRKVNGKSLKPKMIAEVDVYRHAPWDLPAMSCLKTRDRKWFFFCPISKKYPGGGGGRSVHRATEFGYWKATGIDRAVRYCSRPVGKIKTLVFHRGKAPAEERTEWLMHEYRLEGAKMTTSSQDSYVICKVYEKSGFKNRAHFVVEDWESDDDDDLAGGEAVIDNCDVPPPSSAVTCAVMEDTSVAPPAAAAPEEPAALPYVARTIVAALPAAAASHGRAPTAGSCDRAAVAAVSGRRSYLPTRKSAAVSAPRSVCRRRPRIGLPWPQPITDEELYSLLPCLMTADEADIAKLLLLDLDI